MKSFFLKFLLLLSCIGGSITVWAADTVTQKIDHFALIGADSTKVGEAIDITVEARDKDDKIIPTYRGSIFFQASDYNATLPSQGKAIQFTESDSGVKTLSKAVIFKKAGEQTLEVSDAIEDASGKKTIRVEATTTVTPTNSGESITIITPENNAILNAKDLITISGYGKKNSKVNIKLNGSDIATVVTGDDGLYSKTLPTLTQQSNIITVELLDGTNTVIGTAQVRFSMNSTDPAFINLTITPGSTVEASTGVTFIVEADPGLTEVNVNLDGSVIELKESTAGKYIGTTLAPTKSGAYPLSVTLKNNLSQGISKANVATLTVTEKTTVTTPKFVNVKTETIGTKVIFTFEVENPPADLAKFKIAYGMNADSLSEQVLTKDAKNILTASGTYTWYIDKLDPRQYTFRIFGVKADQSLITNFASEPLTATIGTPGCTIENVGAVLVKTSADKSVLSWLSVTGAVSYNIYKYNAAGDPEFIQNTKDTSYTLFLSSGSVVHEDFGVKALCDDKTESADMTKVSKVQTGPGQIALLVIISALLGIFLIRRKWYY